MWWVSAALASDFDAALFGKSFTPKAALGLADEAHPGTLAVLFMGKPLTCEQARGLRQGATGKKPPAAIVVLDFDGAAVGTRANTVLAMSADGLGALSGDATLSTAPAAVGSKGAVTFAMKVPDQAAAGPFAAMVASKPGDHLTGTVPFEMCDAMTTRPSLAATVFEQRDYEIVRQSMFPDSPPAKMKVRVALPKGWVESTDQMGTPQFLAPDGRTRMTLSVSSAVTDFTNMDAEAKDQAEAFQTEGTSGELLEGVLVNAGTYARRWRHRWADNPWTVNQDVFRQDEGWEKLVTCSVTGTEGADGEVFVAVREACVGLTAAP